MRLRYASSSLRIYKTKTNDMQTYIDNNERKAPGPIPVPAEDIIHGLHLRYVTGRYVSLYVPVT